MAINEHDIQEFLDADKRKQDFRSDSSYVGRSWIDGVLVVYDPEDCPQWLADALFAQDEDGNTGAERVRDVWERA